MVFYDRLSKTHTMFGVIFETSMLTFDGSIFYVIIHALLWFGSVIVAGVLQGEITEPDGVKWPDDAPQRTVYMYYMLFTCLAPGLLVVYEALGFMFKGYGMFRVPIQGFLFAFGFLGLAFGTASVPYAVAADVVPGFTFGLFLAAAGLGMFVTFYSEFRTTLPVADNLAKDKAVDDWLQEHNWITRRPTGAQLDLTSAD